QRMGGPDLDQGQVAALGHFLESIPALPAPAGDAAAIYRGKALFEGAAGCVTCHHGPQLTTGAIADVGTGGAVKVASLRGLAWRAPYLHAGCARTLSERFGFCGGGDRHGSTSQLMPNQLVDLVAWLESL